MRDTGRARLALSGGLAAGQVLDLLDPSAAEECLIFSSIGNAAKRSMADIAIGHGERKTSKMRNNECLLDNKAAADLISRSCNARHCHGSSPQFGSWFDSLAEHLGATCLPTYGWAVDPESRTRPVGPSRNSGTGRSQGSSGEPSSMNL